MRNMRQTGDADVLETLGEGVYVGVEILSFGYDVIGFRVYIIGVIYPGPYTGDLDKKRLPHEELACPSYYCSHEHFDADWRGI